MVLGLKFTCMCHQAKITLCCPAPLVAPIDPKIWTRGFFNTLNLQTCYQICSLTTPAIEALKNH